MGRPSKLTAATTAAICDVIAAGGTRTIAARAAGVHPDTLNGWLRRADQEDTETTLEADDYTLRELRALAKTAHVPGYGRLRKADLATAIAAKPSEYSVFSAALKRAEAEAQVEWLSEIARIGKGGQPRNGHVTEEFDAAGNLKTRTIRTTTSRAAWQAYAWLLERRHPADWSRRTELVVADDQTAKVDPLVGVHDELRLARLERQKEQGRS